MAADWDMDQLVNICHTMPRRKEEVPSSDNSTSLADMCGDHDESSMDWQTEDSSVDHLEQRKLKSEIDTQQLNPQKWPVKAETHDSPLHGVLIGQPSTLHVKSTVCPSVDTEQQSTPDLKRVGQSPEQTLMASHKQLRRQSGVIYIKLMVEPSNQLVLKYVSPKSKHVKTSTQDIQNMQYDSYDRSYCARCYDCKETFKANRECLDHVLHSHVEGGRQRNRKVKFECAFCDMVFATLHSARLHMCKTHDIKRCPMQVKTREWLEARKTKPVTEPTLDSNQVDSDRVGATQSQSDANTMNTRYSCFDSVVDSTLAVPNLSVQLQLGDVLDDINVGILPDLSDGAGLTNIQEDSFGRNIQHNKSSEQASHLSKKYYRKPLSGEVLIELSFEPNNELLMRPLGLAESPPQEQALSGDAQPSDMIPKLYHSKCYVCKMTFITNVACQDHILQDHIKDKKKEGGEMITLICSFCDQEHQSLHGARLHMTKWHGVKRCPRAMTGKYRNDWKQLVEKANACEAGDDCKCVKHRPYKCTICPDGYVSLKDCIAHLAKDHFQEVKNKNLRDFAKALIPNRKLRNPALNNALRKCDVEGCKYYDSDIRSVYYHKYWQHKIPIPNWLILFSCPFCPSEARTNNQFWKHVSIHTEEVNTKDKLCHECGKAFKTNQMLKSHVEGMHFPQNNWTCPVCSKSFNRRATVEIHMRTHLDYRPFKCKYCTTYESNTRGAVHTHIRTQHKGENIQAGLVVDEKWLNPKRHWKRETKKRSSSFVTTASADKLCHECGQGFTTVCMLQQHIDVEHAPRYITHELNA